MKMRQPYPIRILEDRLFELNNDELPRAEMRVANAIADREALRRTINNMEIAIKILTDTFAKNAEMERGD